MTAKTFILVLLLALAGSARAQDHNFTKPGEVVTELTLTGTTSGKVSFIAGSAPANTTYTLPAADGSGGQFLSTNGTGGLSWASAVTTSPGWSTVLGNGGSTGGHDATWTDGDNLVFGTSSGTKIGTSTSQKIGFWNASPVAQISSSTDVLAGLVTLGLRAPSNNPPLNLGTGTITAGSAVLSGKATTYNNVATAGQGVPAIYGKDFRQGRTSADGSPIVLYAAVNGTSAFRITADIFATQAVTGTAVYTVAWTQNSTAQTMVVSSTVANTLGTATDLINPDSGTNITAQLTGTFSGTFTVTALVEQLN